MQLSERSAATLTLFLAKKRSTLGFTCNLLVAARSTFPIDPTANSRIILLHLSRPILHSFAKIFAYDHSHLNFFYLCKKTYRKSRPTCRRLSLINGLENRPV